MRTLNSTSKTQKNAASNQPVYLYTIYNYDGSNNNLTFAEWDSDVVFDGVTYSKFPITHDFVGENTQGQVDSVKITLCNISRLIQAYLETYDLHKKKVSLKVVWADQLADTAAYIEDIFYIDSYSADENNVTFILTSKFDMLDLELPARRYMRLYCGWKFKGTQCAYAGSESSCNKTYQRCQELANLLRFGGFPSVPSSNIYVA